MQFGPWKAPCSFRTCSRTMNPPRFMGRWFPWHGVLRPSWPPQVPHEITEGSEMENQHKRLPDSGNGRPISPLSPFPPVQSQTHEPTLRVPSSVRSAMFIVTPTPDARPSSFWSGMNGILHPTALQWWGRQRQPMPLRWSLADPVASLAINMPLQKELFASSRLPRRRRLQICGFGNSEAIERLVTELSPNCHQIVNNLAWKTVVFQRANS